jgi:hypothetical protein
MEVVHIDEVDVDDSGHIDLRIGYRHPNKMCVGWIGGVEGWICLICMDERSGECLPITNDDDDDNDDE